MLLLRLLRPAARPVFLTLLLLLPGLLLAQPAKPLADDARRANLETQVTALEQAFVQQDFDAYIDLIHPDVVRLVGGPEALAGQLRKGLEELTAQGSKVSRFSHGTPSRIVAVDRELQCTVPLVMDFELPTGNFTTKSTLLARSEDGGATWKFMDTLGKDWEAVRRLVPNLSRELKFPARS